MAEVLAGIVCVLLNFCPFAPDSTLITYDLSYFWPAGKISYFLPFEKGPTKIQFKKLLRKFWY